MSYNKFFSAKNLLHKLILYFLLKNLRTIKKPRLLSKHNNLVRLYFFKLLVTLFFVFTISYNLKFLK